MNYNLEMAQLYKDLGLSAGVRSLTEEEKASPHDFEALRDAIEHRINDAMLDKSIILAEHFVVN